MFKKRPRVAEPPSKLEPAYWRGRLFKSTFTYKGRRVEVRGWSVKLQLFGKRKTFSLSSSDPAQAAGEACQIYQTILAHGWEGVTQSRAGTGRLLPLLPGPQNSPASIASDVEYWKRRLIHRNYPEQPNPQADHEFSVRIEHARTSQYFPLGTGDETEAAARAMRIYLTVVNKGWARANACFRRELSLAVRWQDNPLAWTYTTIHTRQCSGPLKPVPDQTGRLQERSVVFIEPDAGIRLALAACANSQEGFRCDTTFAGAAEALREIPRRRVDLAFVNHDLPDEEGVALLDELQRIRPGLTVVSYSVFEDADQLFKSTPGGSVVYMLKRTPPCRVFEPIAELAGPMTREPITSHIRDYFQRLAALLPSGPPSREIARLTPREHDILALLSKGQLAKEIADTLGISIWTVQGHVKSIFEKLNVHTRTEAVVKYLQK